ncbi:hypothetical protein Z517_09579 [Fonsecaea pedrosoi CBS 271.37]|uniref:Major facilitator superfamily (MFS) profile domain-containing protein n=1 Tax=Fonsecaea pedrosoi CBS 271.37 TaxID=1442368 RepID=A0A0D2G8V8_9EURO|nr:uncharacterized protein Z517_09579 [Fonsecaea pedrosoi CBS 271.37]KIW77133.1 hypothetical protein Z517_09579 [Fonsecaea pedrosoi CBS 271.37]
MYSEAPKVPEIQDADKTEQVVQAEVAIHPPADVERAEKVQAKTWLAIICLGATYGCCQGINLIPLNVVNVIQADLGNPVLASWIGTGYSITLGVGILVANSLADLLGRRWFIICGGILTAVGNIVGATASRTSSVVVATSILGFAQGGVTCTIPAASELIPKKYRGYVVGLMNLCLGVWSMSGNLVGHSLAVHTAPGWRSVFWMSLAINAAATLGVCFTYFPAPPLASFRATGQTFLKAMDWIGLFAIVTFQVLVSLGITWITTYGATSARFLAPFLVGIVVAVALGFHQAYLAKNPFLHPFLFRRVRTFTMMCVIALVGGMLFYSLSVFFSTYLELLFDGDNQVKIGVDNLPMAVLVNFGGVSSALTLPILGPLVGTRVMMVVGVLFQVLFIPLMCLVGVHGRSMALAFSALGGFGIGIMETLTILVIQYASPDEYLGFAYGILGLCRGIGGSAGTAIYVTIFSSKSATLVPERVSAAAVAAGLPKSSIAQLLGILTGVVSEPITSVPGINAQIIAVSTLALKKAYLASFKYVWLTSIPFGVISLLCALATKDVSK